MGQQMRNKRRRWRQREERTQRREQKRLSKVCDTLDHHLRRLFDEYLIPYNVILTSGSHSFCLQFHVRTRSTSRCFLPLVSSTTTALILAVGQSARKYDLFVYPRVAQSTLTVTAGPWYRAPHAYMEEYLAASDYLETVKKLQQVVRFRKGAP